MIQRRRVRVQLRTESRDARGSYVYTFTDAFSIDASIQFVNLTEVQIAEWGASKRASGAARMYFSDNRTIPEFSRIIDGATTYEVRSVQRWQKLEKVAVLLPVVGL